jgi:hypothetical protein
MTPAQRREVVTQFVVMEVPLRKLIPWMRTMCEDARLTDEDVEQAIRQEIRRLKRRGKK